MRRAVVFAMLVSATVLAGCTGSESGKNETADDTSSARDERENQLVDEQTFDWEAGIPVPGWNIGDWWQYSVVYTSGETYDTKIIVYAEDASNYYVTSEDRELQLRSGITHYPTMGAVNKATMDQLIHGVEVSYLRFPMKNGTWSGPFRDFEGDYVTHRVLLDAGGDVVPGFRTVMNNSADGTLRFTHGWSPVTKWFTDFTFDFDGTEPPDVTYVLKAWGTGYNGTLPVVELVDRVHRVFPTVSVAPPDAADPSSGVPAQPPPAQETIMIDEEGSGMLVAIFAGAGGAGQFTFQAVAEGDPQERYAFEWHPSTAGGYFAWDEHPGVTPGAYQVAGAGAAQSFAFLFGEVYEVHDSEVTL